MTRGWLLLCITLLLTTCPAAPPAAAQQPVAEYYDTNRIVTVKGIVMAILVQPPPAPMLIMIEAPGAAGQKSQKDQKDQKEMWVVSGNQITALRREGFQLIGPGAAIKSGDEITVTAWLPKDTQKAAKALSAVVQMPSLDGKPSGPPGFIADVEAQRARLAYGLEIIKAGGETLRFGDVPRP
jgi:hypothetical protein